MNLCTTTTRRTLVDTYFACECAPRDVITCIKFIPCLDPGFKLGASSGAEEEVDYTDHPTATFVPAADLVYGRD